ncbi:pentatricopeptide repeat-containing protein At2g38420, mitochondrial [Apium graveolens]|uniref:pentatricopeptide repeat-containing protein At2g38420, mitochondrial n=1 Tax=Apium graveolens TaxID=4045 RepID=UPI003D7AAA19
MSYTNYSRIFLRFKSSFPKTKRKNNPFNFYLRKNRKWPLSPYNAKYQEKLNQQEALRALKQSSSLLSPTHLLSSLIDSFTMYNCNTTPLAYHFVIKTLIKSLKWQELDLVLDRLEKVEIFETPEIIFIDLIESYGNCNKIQESIDLFFKIPNFRCSPSVDCLNCLLLVVCRNRGWLEMVPEIVLKSRKMNIRIDESSYCILIKALCRINKVNHAFGLLVYMVDDGFELDERMCSLILSTLCRQGDLSVDAFTGYLEEMKAYGFCPGRVDWCNVIRFLIKNGKGMDALNVLNQMKVDGIKPDVVCYTMVLDGVIEDGDYAKADELFDEMLVLGVVPDIWTYNVYLCGLFKQKNIDAGMDMLACIENVGCKPDVVTYNGILSTLCESGELKATKEVVNLMISKGVQRNLKTYEILLGGMIRCGKIREACNLLEEMVEKDFVPQCSTFLKLLPALGQTGPGSKELEVLSKITDSCVAPKSSC